MQRFFYRLLSFAFLICTQQALGKSVKDTLFISRIFHYAATVDTSFVKESHSYAYQRFFFSTDKRNALLMAVPTMYGVAHGGKRQFAGEFYDRIDVIDSKHYDNKRLIEINTVPHRRKTLPSLLKYLTPEIYDETILEGRLLSPFHKKNAAFYRYKVIDMRDGTIKITFKPKIDNTQLLSGRAICDPNSGRIISTDLYGEYDMVRFRLSLEMWDSGLKTLFPRRCQLTSLFKFLGSRFSARYLCIYGLEKDVPDQPTPSHDTALMDSVRPEPLAEDEVEIFAKFHEEKARKELLQEQAATDSEQNTAKSSGKGLAKTILWDIIGSHALNRIKSNFGTNDEGFFRINPILNPLYLGYSDRKGMVYKFDIKAGYAFTPNRDITARFKSGYSFKQKQLYYFIPLHFNYNKRRHAFIALDIDHGHRIYNSEIKKEVSDDLLDSLAKKDLRLDYFRDTYINIYNNYDISDYLSFNAGFSFHQRRAITPEAFKLAYRPSVYKSTAPRLEVQYRPIGWKGPAITLDYERGLKGIFKSDTEYERWEIDGSYIHTMSRLKSVSMRVGAGFYSKRSERQYFLDFSNFRDDNIYGGWNDEWSGDFNLLKSEWYNASRYYVRTNFTYESPLLLLSRIPWLGHFIEMERIYSGAVVAKQLNPYVEAGYGVTTRWLTLGAFASNKNGRFERVGFRVGIELFRNW